MRIRRVMSKQASRHLLISLKASKATMLSMGSLKMLLRASVFTVLDFIQ